MSRPDIRAALHAKGFRPDGKGALVRLSDTEWDSKHGRTHSEGEVRKPAIRVPRARLNGVERRWLGELQTRYPASTIQPQFRVRVSAFDSPTVTHYTADFAIWTNIGELPTFWQCLLWECKDSRRHGHSDELTRPKMARAMNPWITAVFMAAWDGKHWNERQLA